MYWTEEQILALAPDTASVKAGKGQANSGKWLRLGASDEALWGEVKGSGSTPYQTRIDLRQIGYKCSCPSRKFPCKHAIGLFLLYSRTLKSFTNEPPPDWVKSWLEQRNKKAEKQSKKVATPVDEKAQRKRAARRAKKVVEGTEEMQRWLKDLARGGLSTLPAQGSSYWKNTVSRMVDAQAAGLSALVRSMSNINYSASGWESQAWELQTQLYLATETFNHRDHLPAAVKEDLKTIIGWTYNQEELKQQAGIEDIWGVLGKQETQEERLTVIKYWLKGEQSNRYALILQFVAPGQPRDHGLVPGTRVEAELVFYPGSFPLRAVVKAYQQTHPFSFLSGYDDLTSFEQAYASAISVYPWLHQMPAVFTALTPIIIQNQLLLMDRDSKAIPSETAQDVQWKILALSGGKPVQLCGVVENHTLYPLGIWALSEYQLL